MSSPGHIYREQVFRFSKSEAGSETISFDVENDGVVLIFERLSGEAAVTASLSSELPGDMSDFHYETITNLFTDPMVVTKAFVLTRKGKIDLSWAGEVSFSIVVKMVSAQGVALWNSQLGLSSYRVDVIPDKSTNIWQKDVHGQLIQINQELDKLLNNLRYITSIEEPGEEF